MRTSITVFVLLDCMVDGRQLHEGDVFNCYIYDSDSDLPKRGLMPIKTNVDFKRLSINSAEEKKYIKTER